MASVLVEDPTTGGTVEVEIRKDLATGAMVGVDASFIEQLDLETVWDPYNSRERILLRGER